MRPAPPAPITANGSNCVEENVCVQPFVWCKSIAPSGAVTTISNITWEQIEFGIPNGRIPLSAWTYQVADTNKFVYLMQRTKDSGTRRCETQGAYYQFNDTCAIYHLRLHQQFLLQSTTNTHTTYGGSPNGIVGPAGFDNANLNWGYGYVGGGDIANSLNNPSANNQAIAYLSMGDSKGVPNGSSGTGTM